MVAFKIKSFLDLQEEYTISLKVGMWQLLSRERIIPGRGKKGLVYFYLQASKDFQIVKGHKESNIIEVCLHKQYKTGVWDWIEGGNYCFGTKWDKCNK